MADVTSNVTIDITGLSITYNGTNITVLSGSAVSDDANDYANKMTAQRTNGFVISAEFMKSDGSTFANGDEFTFTTHAYAATGGRTNCCLSLVAETDLKDSSGTVIGQWYVTGSTTNLTTRTFHIKLNSNAAGQAVLSDVGMSFGTNGVTSYGVGFDCIAKISIAGIMFAYCILARPKVAFGDAHFQGQSGNDNISFGVRVGTALYNELINSRGVTGTTKKALAEIYLEDSTSIVLNRALAANACPYSLTEQNGCFVTDYLTPAIHSAMTEITPTSGETYASFKTRVMASPLQYGFFEDSDGMRIVYYAGELGVDTPQYSTFRSDDFAQTVTDGMIEQGWYLDTDESALYAIYKAAVTNSSLVGDHITSHHFSVSAFYETALEDETHPVTTVITYNPGESSESSRTYSGNVKLTGMFGTITVKPYAATVMKYDSDSKTPLEGATVKLQRKSGSSWADYTPADGGGVSRQTGSNGLAEFESLGIGTYRVVETAAPTGYTLEKQDGYDADVGGVVSDEFSIAASDTEGAKVQMPNKITLQYATVTYVDYETGIILQTDTFSGDSGSAMEYDADAVIATYTSAGYELVSSTYEEGTLFDDDPDVIQAFKIVLSKESDMDIDCTSCDELKTNATSFVTNGVTTTVCTSLKNDTGFNPKLKTLHTDCEDLDTANDCLIGIMDSDLEKYEACDWKQFMHNFIPNLYTMLKAGICALCGIWENIHSLTTRVSELEDVSDRIDCMIDYMMSGADFSFGESTSETSSRLIPGTGVDFSLRSGSDEHASDVIIRYVAGGLCQLSGSLRTFTESFVDADGNTKAGNSIWDFEASNYDLPAGGELLYEIRIKRSEYPQVKRFYNGTAFQAGAGNNSFEANIIYFNAGAYAYGQHGWCDSDGTPSKTGYSSGHLVPDGWMYVQLRMARVDELNVINVTDGAGNTKQGTNFSPRGFLGIRLNQSSIEC